MKMLDVLSIVLAALAMGDKVSVNGFAIYVIVWTILRPYCEKLCEHILEKTK